MADTISENNVTKEYLLTSLAHAVAVAEAVQGPLDADMRGSHRRLKNFLEMSRPVVEPALVEVFKNASYSNNQIVIQSDGSVDITPIYDQSKSGVKYDAKGNQIAVLPSRFERNRARPKVA